MPRFGAERLASTLSQLDEAIRLYREADALLEEKTHCLLVIDVAMAISGVV